jgi:hypothetical protein
MRMIGASGGAAVDPCGVAIARPMLRTRFPLFRRILAKARRIR